jgi:hypothetical protein
MPLEQIHGDPRARAAERSPRREERDGPIDPGGVHQRVICLNTVSGRATGIGSPVRTGAFAAPQPTHCPSGP